MFLQPTHDTDISVFIRQIKAPGMQAVRWEAISILIECRLC